MVWTFLHYNSFCSNSFRSSIFFKLTFQGNARGLRFVGAVPCCCRLFGLNKAPAENTTLNYLGVASGVLGESRRMVVSRSCVLVRMAGEKSRKSMYDAVTLMTETRVLVSIQFCTSEDTLLHSEVCKAGVSVPAPVLGSRRRAETQVVALRYHVAPVLNAADSYPSASRD